MAIHPTAVIHPKAELADDVEVGPYCVIDEHVRIGPGCRLFQNVYLTGWTEIGNGCVFHPGVIVGHEPQDVKYRGERSFCRIGPNTVLREYVTIHRGTIPDSETAVGESCFLLGASHVAHNCRVGNHVTMVNAALLAGHVEVGDRVMIGGAAAVHQFVRIGELAMIRGNSRVPKDVVPFALMDEDGRVAGINRVGLRRAGITTEESREIREMYRVLLSTSLDHVARVARVEAMASTPAGKRLAAFVRGESRRGLAGRSRVGRRGDSSE